MTTYIGQPTDQYRFTPPPSARRILPFHSSPAALPAERANFDQLYIIQQGGRGVTREQIIAQLE